MQEKYIEKECLKHGITRFALEKRGFYRCMKCITYNVTKRRDIVKQKAIDYKGGKCEECGYNKCNAALEFHHVEPEHKDFSLSANGHTRSWASIQVELDKCKLLCANCHRETHDGGRLAEKHEKYKNETAVYRSWKHGTPSGYTYHKCRCAECVQANTDRHTRYRNKKKLKAPSSSG